MFLSRGDRDIGVARKIPWRRPWQPTPVFLPGETQEQRTLVSLAFCRGPQGTCQGASERRGILWRWRGSDPMDCSPPVPGRMPPQLEKNHVVPTAWAQGGPLSPVGPRWSGRHSAGAHFSYVQIFVILWTIDHQAPLSMGFSNNIIYEMNCRSKFDA